MKQRFAAVLTLTLLLAACSKKSGPAATASTPAATSSAPAATAADPVLPAAHPVPDPGDTPPLSISANGSTKPTLYKGFPLSIAVSRESDGAAPTLSVRDSAGAPATWPLAGPVGKGRDFSWSLPGESSAGLAAGVWILRAEAPGTEASEIELRVADAPAAPTETQRREMFLGKAGALLAAGKADDAAALAKEEQARAPKDPNPWVMEGDALRQNGKTAEAAARYREALRLHRAAIPKVKEAPVFLLRRLAEVEPAPFEK
jgi:hypothetical protein